jgi:processive 1,2-diacylglycerol beta-glucosyltransferase
LVRARGRIVVISAAVGAGHNTSTDELARRLERRGFDVERHDFMTLLPGRLGGGSLRVYNAMLNRVPWVYGTLFAIGNRRATAAVTRALLSPARRRLLGRLKPDVRAVVSTYPLASQLIGPLRTVGRLEVPTITYVTDFAVHPHWLSPGVDAHLTPHAVSARRAGRAGAAGALAAGALVADRFHQPPEPGARSRFGLPAGPLALVVAGSWGVGEIAATADDIAATGVATPVVVCGRNAALRRRLTRAGVAHVLGWVEDMPTLMHAVDVLVENAGGLMALEGMACDLPVLTYRPIPGHGRLSAAALASAGISRWVTDRAGLGPALTDLMSGPGGRRQRSAAKALFETDAAQPIADLADTAPTRLEPRISTPTQASTAPRRSTVDRRRRSRALALTAAVGAAAALGYRVVRR